MPFASTLGALLVGGLAAMYLSGVLTMQFLLYFQVYPTDNVATKFMVAVIWALDLLHVSMVCATDWHYLIVNYGSADPVSMIYWTVIVTVVLTAVITFLVYCFYAHRIWTLSNHKWFPPIPILVLGLIRVGGAIASAVEMAKWKTFDAFHEHAGWVFTVGLAAASICDLLIAFTVTMLLRKSRTGFQSMDRIIDSITLHTVENGLITSVFTVTTLICWITMPDNFIFLAFHFAISKLYANSFLATLNARKILQGKQRAISEYREHNPPPNGASAHEGRSREVDIVTHDRSRLHTQKSFQSDFPLNPNRLSDPPYPP